MSAKTMTVPAVVKTVTVNCTPAEAFRYFTADIGKWWPMATHSCTAFVSDFKEKAIDCYFEPRLGGRIVEREAGGKEHIWGTVLSWDPPDLISFTWHPMRDENTAQTVEVRFLRVAGGTDVVLTHGGWERLGEHAAQERDGYDNGWEAVFVKSFKDYVRSLRGQK